MNILFVGFSVTAAKPSYYEKISSLCDEGLLSYDVDYLALGGLHCHQLAYLFPSLLNQKTADIIVFELLTSGARKLGDTDPYRYYESPLRSMIDLLISLDKKIVFLNLYRKDVDYSNDKMLQTFSKLSADYNIPRINTYRNIDCISDDVNNYIWDVVHTTKQGATFYCDEVVDFFKDKSLSDFNHNKTVLSTDGFYNMVPLIHKKENCFMGKGFFLPWQSITAYKSVVFEFSEPINSEMLCFVTGPTASQVEVKINDIDSFIVKPYDVHSYYERVFVVPFMRKGIKKVVFKLIDAVPDLTLIKSEWDCSCRQVKLVSFFCRDEEF